MPEPAFLVEGLMEKRIVEHLCSNKIVRLIGCNGKRVTMDAVGRRVVAHLRMLRNRHFPIIIIFDREKRLDTCAELKRQLVNYLREQGFTDGYEIAIADRSTESWFLVDWAHIAPQNGLEARDIGDSEGSLGKGTIRRLLPQDMVYNEVIHGAQFFLQARPNVMYLKSESFRALVKGSVLECSFVQTCLAQGR